MDGALVHRRGGLGAAGGAAASATAGYPDNRLVMIAEPGDADGDYVRYFRDGEELSLDDLTWVDGGRSGKAVLFDGSDQYLTLDYNQLQMQQMTFSAWVNWYGEDTAQTPPESSDADASGDADGIGAGGGSPADRPGGRLRPAAVYLFPQHR